MHKKTSIISKNIRIRYPKYFDVGEHSIVDDFCYISTKFSIGDCFHVASGCSIIGGKGATFIAGSFGCLASGVRVLCKSDDFVNDISTILPPDCEDIKTPLGLNIILDDFVTVGANSVIMPQNKIPIGVAIGALSFVPWGFDFKPWTVYAGIGKKFRPICLRNEKQIRNQYEEICKRHLRS